MNKKGSGVSEMVSMIPVLVMVAVIATAVFGVSATSYAYDISVRDAEARLLGRGIANCLSEDGVLDLDKVGGNSDSIISYCGMRGSERIFVGVDVMDSSDKKVAYLSEGDSGLLWVRDLFGKAVLTGNAVSGWDNENVEKIAKYNPGYL